MKEYRVLTLWQPWASLLVHGIKTLETRPNNTSWTMEKGSYLVHAASKWTREQERICQTEPFRTALGKTLGLRKFSELPLGQIIGAIDVEYCGFAEYNGGITLYSDKIGRSIEVFYPEKYFGNFEKGRSIWKCINPRILQTPIIYKGSQGYYQRYKGDKSLLIFK